MATIYAKTVNDKTLILSPREYFMRPFDFGTDWTEMRIGMYMSGVSAANDNGQNVNETVALSTVADRVAFGLKNSSNAVLPGLAGARYMGLTNAVTSNSNTTDGVFRFGSTSGSYGNNMRAAVMVDTTITQNAEVAAGISLPTSTGATNYCGFYGLKFVVSNIGTATQAVTMTVSSSATVTASTYPASALLTTMNNATYSSMGAAIAWNDGSAAYDLPDALWVRMPFFNNRIRISCIQAIRYAP